MTDTREAFLDLIADGELTIDYDGDEENGRTVDCSRYRIEGDLSSLEEFCDALGIKSKYMETLEDAINRAIDQLMAQDKKKADPEGPAKV